MTTNLSTNRHAPANGGALNPLSVVLVEDHSLFAEALAIILGMEGYIATRISPDVDMNPASRLLPSIVRTRPGTVLLDLDLGGSGDGLALIRPLTLAGIHVVVVTGSADRVRWGECVAAGARKVLSKSAPLTDILTTISRLNSGLAVMSMRERTEMLEYWGRRQAEQREITGRLEMLTRREAEVLGQLMSGRQVGDIATDRFVSESTVRTQVKSVLAKLQVGSQLTAVGLAYRAKWHPPMDASTLVS